MTTKETYSIVPEPTENIKAEPEAKVIQFSIKKAKATGGVRNI